MRIFEALYNKIIEIRINPGIIIISIFMNVLVLNVSASPDKPDQKQINGLKTTAIRYKRAGDIYNAIEYYRQYLAYESGDIKLSYRLANLYFDTRNYIKANQYFDSVINIDPKKYPVSYYRKGIVCMNLGYYDKAKESFTKFRKGLQQQ